MELTIHLFDGMRKPFTGGKATLHVRQQGKSLLNTDVGGSSNVLKFDAEANSPVALAIVASCTNYRQCGYFLVPNSGVRELDLMLMHKNENFDIAPNVLDQLRDERPAYREFVKAVRGNQRSSPDGMQDDPKRLACFLNILEAIQWLPNGAEVIKTLQTGQLRVPTDKQEWAGVQQDRIFVDADEALANQLQNKGVFEKVTDLAHSGSEWAVKERGRFAEANLNFNIRNHPKTAGLQAEIDLDYYHDTDAHIALEVIPNWIGKLWKRGLTNPARTYAMRWMAMRNYKKEELKAADPRGGGKVDFDPLFTISGG